MGTPHGRTDSSIEELLKTSAPQFEFFQAVRLLSAAIRDRSGSNADSPQSLLRFRPKASLAFPPAELDSLASVEDGFELIINFLGLTGPLGILPHFYTEQVMSAEADSHPALPAFFNIFNNRFAWLFYDAWEKHRFAASYERDASRSSIQNFCGCQTPSRFTRVLFGLVGLGTEGLRDKLPYRALLLYAGLLAQRPRCADNLKNILQDFFKIPVALNAYEGAWVKIDEDDLSWLSGTNSSAMLGSALLGDEVWNAQSRFQIQLGPLDLRDFKRFAPESPAIITLQELVRFYTDHSLQFDVQLILRASQVPGLRLGCNRHSTRLGYGTWLKTEQFENDVNDLIISEGGSETQWAQI